ncbi:MAG TPA: hypothetical protein VMF06_07195 [Candidatus Limnocylindria bacterium]|jgi:anti-sigma-K factor RskA|nr:hypothetical protein [Candidatus Limnocylindria bacterium]
MLNEKQQDLACWYVLGVLTGPEAGEFERSLRCDQELRYFTADLREALVAWVQEVARVPPPQLRDQVLMPFPAISTRVPHSAMPLAWQTPAPPWLIWTG